VHFHPKEAHAHLSRGSFHRTSLPVSSLPADGSTDSDSRSKRPGREEISKKLEMNKLSVTGPGIDTANMFLKLFQTHPTQSGVIPPALQSADQATTLKFAEFIMARCAKLEATIEALNQSSSVVDVHSAADTLMRRIASILGAQYYTIYSFPENAMCTTPEMLPDATVECSNWVGVGNHIQAIRIFGLPHFLQVNPILNIYHATASEYFTNACHEHYPDKVQCFLSAAILSESGNLSAILELANKVTPGAAPYFNVEDEFVFRSTLATWSLVLKEASAETERDARGELMRAMFDDLHGMSWKDEKKDLLDSIILTVKRLVQAEKVSIHFNLQELALDPTLFLQLQEGKPALVAHGTLCF
jgi:hypothetical protein